MSDRAEILMLPGYSGDGYGYGGGIVLSIRGKAIPLGEGSEAKDLAEEIARRWNSLEDPK